MGGSLEKRESRDLGLVAKNVQEEPDLGLTTQDIQGASRALFELLNFDDVQPTLLAEIKDHLEKQLWFAQQRQDQDEKRFQSRRRFLRTAGLATLFVGVPAAVVGLVHLTSPSPEAITQKTEGEKRLKEQFEKNHMLGLTPSIISSYGWRVRYLSQKEGVKFSEGEKPEIFTVQNEQYIYFPARDFFGSKTATAVTVSAYKRSDDVVVPKLNVLVDKDSLTYNWEEWLLRDQATEEIDNRVVVFENVRSGETKYAAISMAKSESPVFEVKLMRKI